MNEQQNILKAHKLGEIPYLVELSQTLLYFSHKFCYHPNHSNTRMCSQVFGISPQCIAWPYVHWEPLPRGIRRCPSPTSSSSAHLSETALASFHLRALGAAFLASWVVLPQTSIWLMLFSSGLCSNIIFSVRPRNEMKQNRKLACLFPHPQFIFYL